MKIDANDIQQFIQMLDEAESFRPIVKKAVDAILSYGPEIHALAESLVMGISEIRVKQVAYFEGNGFTREEAIYLTMDEWYAIRNSLGKKKK